MEDHSFKENGRHHQYFRMWKKTSTFKRMEDDLKFKKLPASYQVNNFISLIKQIVNCLSLACLMYCLSVKLLSGYLNTIKLLDESIPSINLLSTLNELILIWNE